MAPAVSFDLDGVIMRGPWSTAIQPHIWAHLARSPGLAHLAEVLDQLGMREEQLVVAVVVGVHGVPTNTNTPKTCV